MKRSSRKGELKETFFVREMSSISTLKVAWEHYPWGTFWHEAEKETDETYFSEQVAKTNKLELLKWAREEKKCEWDDRTIWAAARQGNLGMVKYCVANECPIDENACAYAAESGNLECLKYLHEEVKAPWESCTASWAAESGHLHILEYLVEREYDEYGENACVLCCQERPFRLFEVLARNRQSALELLVRSSSAQSNQHRMFTIPPRQQLSSTRRLSIRRWRVIRTRTRIRIRIRIMKTCNTTRVVIFPRKMSKTTSHFHIQNTRTHTHTMLASTGINAYSSRSFASRFASSSSSSSPSSSFRKAAAAKASTTTNRFSALFVSSAFPQSDDTTPKGNTKENDDTNTSALSSSSSSSFSFSKDAIDSASITIGSTAFAHFVTAFPAFADEGLEAAPGVLDGQTSKSYYATLFLFVLSAPGLYSLVKWSAKSKISRKTFELPGPMAAGDAVAVGRRRERDSMYFKRNNYVVADAGEVITFEGNIAPERGTAAYITFCIAVGLLCVGLVCSIALPAESLVLFGVNCAAERKVLLG